MKQEHEFNYNLWDLCRVIILIIIARQLINIHIVCLNQLKQIITEGYYLYDWLKIYVTSDMLIWGILFAIIVYFAKKRKIFFIGCVLTIGALFPMILLYYIQPYQLWDMLLGYNFVPINQ